MDLDLLTIYVGGIRRIAIMLGKVFWFIGKI